MHTLQDRAKEGCVAFEEDLRACVALIFERFPSLTGFSVAERVVASPAGDSDSDTREWELYISDIAIEVDAGREFSGQLYSNISQALSDLCHERPADAHLLKDRTFARSWH